MISLHHSSLAYLRARSSGGDDAGFEEPDDEGAGAGERVEDRHAGVGEALAEVGAAQLVGAAQDEVDDLDGCVDDAEGFGLFGEGVAEELLVQVVDDGLAAGGVGDRGGAARARSRRTVRGVRFRRPVPGLRGRRACVACRSTPGCWWRSWTRPNRASNTGAVIRCWLSIEIASSAADRVVEVGAQPVPGTPSNAAVTCGDGCWRGCALMRAIWASLIRATSAAHWSQYSRVPTRSTMRE